MKFWHGSRCLWVAQTLLIALGLAGGASQALAAISVSTPIPVPQLRDIVPDAVSVAVLEDGSFAIIGTKEPWAAPGEDLGEVAVYYFGSVGAPIGAPTILLRGGGSISGSIGALGDRYFVTWSRASEHKTMAGFFSREGVALGRAFPWPDSAISPYQWFYRYGRGPAWRILPVTFHQDGTTVDGSPYFQPSLQVFSSNARPLGSVFDIVPSQRRVEIDDIALNGSGRLVVISSQCRRKPLSVQPCRRGLQIFDDGGRVRSPFVTKDVGSGGVNTGDFHLAVTDGGAFLISWGDGNTRPVRLLARKYDRAGRASSEVVTVATNTEPNILGNESVRALPGGKFALSWASSVPGLSAITLTELSSGTMEVLPSVVVATDDVYGAQFHLELNSAGDGVVAWMTLDPDGHFSGHLRLVSFR